MKLSIIIPVFNEKETIQQIISVVEKVKLPKQIKQVELVIVDDCSKDGTGELLRKLQKKNRKILFHEVNKGKGAALGTGFNNATGDIVIIQDADLEYDPHEYPRLLQPILDDKADVVYGSRFMGGGPHRVLYFWHTLANKMLTLISNMFSDLNLTDMETCYKVFRKKVLDKISIEENRFGFEPEVTAKIGELSRSEGVRIYEIGISYYGRTYAEGKKIGLKDAVRALWCIFKYNTSRFAHLIKYGINGLVVALSQLVFIILLVGFFGFSSKFMQNVANAISIEISIITGFFLHSFITWRYRYSSIGEFFKKCLSFHIITGLSFATRVILFYILLNIGVGYLPNTIIGIGVAVLLNFIGYDRMVFRNNSAV
jgi:glycosyltransferase involved in cell wall biosynthesis